MKTPFRLSGLGPTMADSQASGASPDGARGAGRSLYNVSLDVVMTGVAIIVPLIVTLYILSMALEFVTNALRPFVGLLRWLGVIEWVRSVEVISVLVELEVWPYVVDVFTEIIALVVLFAVVVVVGSIGHNRFGEQVIGYVDLAIASIPGVGTVYRSFRRMGDVMLDEGAENFQEIKLVRCLDDEMYVIGFETSSSPETVEEATGHDEMVTMFLPLAPNPVTGGFLTHVPRERVMDVDMTIEEGVRSILTSGVASGDGDRDPTQLTMGDLETVADFERLQGAIGRGDEEDAEDDGPER